MDSTLGEGVCGGVVTKPHGEPAWQEIFAQQLTFQMHLIVFGERLPWLSCFSLCESQSFIADQRWAAGCSSERMCLGHSLSGRFSVRKHLCGQQYQALCFVLQEHLFRFYLKKKSRHLIRANISSFITLLKKKKTIV